MKLKKGLVQVYTGNGKGKTTAAFGLALRATGAGLKVYILQFIKGRFYSELAAFKRIKGLKIVQSGRGCFIRKKPNQRDRDLAEKGLLKAEANIMSGIYDVVILDEVNVALHFELLNTEDIITLIKKKPKNVELVLTGRYCPQEILKQADLVTEMREIKHPYRKGIGARRGIEY
ncbi:MAG: cob(I)yrinic acid a,c-diamide adenosyltransferase [Omnitrophica bacterium]|nr:cob(I)yrinic acid a,c-diamide adenosyltransferase [Candidatus Omnitrophota bacterium]